MEKYKVSVVRYEKAYESVKKAVELCGGLDHLPDKARVFIKPNIVFWTRACKFPKWGVITTSRVIEDVVRLLKEHGIEDITIGEGIVADPRDKQTPAHAFETLGYKRLEEKYGVKTLAVMERPFEKVDLGDGITLKFNTDIINSDFVVNLPAMKTHNQTIVSLGIKNLKGIIDIPSRKKCHSADPEKDLHYHIARLADKMPPMLTLVDGIYTVERGPGFDGKMHRSNLLAASADVLSADMAAARLLGHDPRNVPYLAHAAANRGRPADLSDVEILGENIENAAMHHEWDFAYSREKTRELPLPLAKQGVEGLFYRKFDSTMCTYCTGLNGLVLTAIRHAWKGEPWDNVEVLTGKSMEPTPGMNATILLGQCMYKKNKDHPNIGRMIAVKGCPPDPKKVVKALHEAGIEADPNLFEQAESLPGFFMSRYKDRPEFEESFFRVE
ncbi:MAG: DUF362 domain-containing protein [Desulfobacteraceae bacterium]|nr:DUF362 domain-containing protein [Desulfobacteraceae bacterium]